MQQFGHSSMNQIDTFPISQQARMTLGQGMGAHVGQNHPLALHNRSVASLNFGPSPELYPGNFQGLEQQLMYSQQHQAPRRNTWSGVNAEPTYQTSQRNAIERAPQVGRPASASSFPDAWFEVEEPANPRGQEEPIPLHPTGAKVFPDNWFEVQEGASGDTDEPIRYSPEGDLTGKLPAPKPSARRGGTLHSTTVKRHHSGEGKMSDDPVPMRRSLAEVAGTVNPQVRRRQNPGSTVAETSLQNLGLQLDDETVDFLTRLRFGSNSDH